MKLFVYPSNISLGLRRTEEGCEIMMSRTDGLRLRRQLNLLLKATAPPRKR